MSRLAKGMLVAVLAPLGVTWLHRFVLVGLLETEAPGIALILPVLAAAWVGGFQSGLVATLVSALVGTFLFPGATGFALLPPTGLRVALFMLFGVLMSWLVATMRATQQRIIDRQRQLEHEISERRNIERAEHTHRERLAEEMRRREAAEQALREREERIRMAVESANIGTWDFNPVTGERNWSDRAKIMFGLAPDADVTNVSFLDRLHPDDRQRATQAVEQALDPNGDGGYEIECRLLLPDGAVRWFIAKGQALFEGESPQRRATRFIGTVFEITERRRTEEALRASDVRLRGIVNNTSAVIYLKDLQGKYLMVNRQFEQVFNTTEQEILGKTDIDILPREIVGTLQDNDRQVRETGVPLKFEEVVPQADGLHTYVSVKFPLFDDAGRCNSVGGVSTDITDRQIALAALEAEQEMLRHTVVEQDQQRQWITYEIHDGLVQYATGALMQLDAVRHMVHTPDVAEKIEETVSALQKAVAEGRRLINGIRTPVLDDWGVVAAVEQLLSEEDRAHVNVEFVKDDTLGRMEPRIEEALYRITQEALTNAYRHSHSRHVSIAIERREDRVHLEVKDAGVGFSVGNGANTGHGLRGMKNRARIAGGHCKVESAPGKGTQIVVDLPYLSRP